MGTEWASYVDEITSKACNSLGVPPKAVTAELYKLVLYEAASFFVPHRDTEKANGMFGTLVIVLPSIYKVPLLAVLLGNANSITPTTVPFSINRALMRPAAFPTMLRRPMACLQKDSRPALHLAQHLLGAVLAVCPTLADCQCEAVTWRHDVSTHPVRSSEREAACCRAES